MISSGGGPAPVFGDPLAPPLDPIVAVLRAGSTDRLLPVVETLLQAGILSIELTLTTPGLDEAADRVIELASQAGGRVGLGTVTSATQVDWAHSRGFRFVVSPATLPPVISAARDAGIPVYPGALSPTEVWTAWSSGAAAVKLFPADAVGPGYIRHLHGPYPQIPFLPSGGIPIEQIDSWLAAGAASVSIGGPLLRDCFEGGSLDELSARAARAVEVASHVTSTGGPA